jgi:hypothetical protein
MRLANCDTRPLEGRKLHRCDVCGRLDVWDDGWSCYGPMEPEFVDDLLKVCSDACRSGLDAEKAYEAKCKRNKQQRKHHG